MQMDQERDQIIGEQHERILRLTRRLTIVTCLASASFVTLIGVLFLFGIAVFSGGGMSITARDEARMQRDCALQAQQIAIVEAKRAARAEMMARQTAEAARERADRARQALNNSSRSAASDDQPPFAAPFH